MRNAPPGTYQIVYPSTSILAEPSVAVVDKNAEAHGTLAAAQAYLRFLYTPEAQDIEARNFGGWAKAQQVHVADGAVFDQIMSELHR